MSIDSIPNWMTVLRIAVTPIIAIMIWIDDTSYGYLVAFILFTIASITDYLDGMLARQMKIESGFGEMLDPIADKMLIGAVLLFNVRVLGRGFCRPWHLSYKPDYCAFFLG